MAIYHLSVKPVSRAGGRSATAAAAYRSAEKIHDQTTNQTFDYTRKRGVEHAEIVLPTEAARRDINWARDRQALWNAAEAAENRSNSRVAREYELALPHELNHSQRVELVRAFSVDIADRYGVAVDFAIHAPHRHGDERNHHAHVLTTTRTIEADGLGKKSEIEWSDGNRRKAGLGPAKEEITLIRERWETLTNEYLKEHGIEARIDHRSLEAQGVEREPQSHLGPAVSGMERRGMETDVGKRLELEALEVGQQRLDKAAQLGRLERETAGLERSILDLSGDLEGAKRERDMQRAKSQELSRPKPSIEQLQREGREKWLAMRAEQKAAKLLMAQTPEQVVGLVVEQVIEKGAEKALESEAKPKLSIEEQQAQARERWLAYRQAQALGQPPERVLQKGLEKGQEKGMEQGPKGMDGPEIE
jgi:ATP-dependent exoDNAse (exonuclease V) alpha subunit